MDDPKFSLRPELAPARGGGRWPFRRSGEEYAGIYETSLRSIRRYVALGREVEPPEPPDLPPLDEPAAMPGWWTRRCKQRVPDNLLAAARRATQTPPPPPDPSPPAGAPAAAPGLTGEGEGEPKQAVGIDLSSLETAAGMALLQARQFVGATFLKLQTAYAAGKDDEIRLWQPRWEKACETLRRAEAAANEERKRSGELMPVADMVAEWTQLLEVQRIMRGSMPRRVIARVPGLPVEFAELLGVAIIAEREAEDDVLRNLQQFRSMDEVEQRFALAA